MAKKNSVLIIGALVAGALGLYWITRPRGETGLLAGPGGLCQCPACGATVDHQANVPCITTTCPACGAGMRRQL